MGIEDEIVAAGAEIIWIDQGNGATAQECYERFQNQDSTKGWCVGDGETLPVAGTFDNSPLAVNRGFDIIVDRRSMTIVWDSSHGSTAGNDNPSAQDVLEAVQAAVAQSRAR
ncbi:MAG: hypothetical protein AAGA48_03035 [Myxococcota bacterium]